MTIEFPSTKSIKDGIRDAIGQDVTFIIQGTATACPVCSGLSLYDSVNEQSLDQWCTTCSGAYWLVIDSSVTVTAHVRWLTGDEADKDVAGEVLNGDCSVTIANDDLTSAQVDGIREIRADDRILKVYRTMQRGVPTRDRIRFICKEQGKE